MREKRLKISCLWQIVTQIRRRNKLRITKSYDILQGCFILLLFFMIK